MIVLLLLCFLPALLVFGFVKLFKTKLAKDPSKKQLLQYVVIYLLLASVVGLLLYGAARLISK